MINTALKLLKENPGIPSSLRDIPEESLTARDIGLAAAAGDSVALKIWRLTGEYIGTSCAAFAGVLDPELIVIFGGVAAAFPFMKEAIKESFRRNALFLNRDTTRFSASGLSDADAPLIGAAALSLEALRNRP